MKKSFVTPIIEKVARRLGIGVKIEPKYRWAGQLALPDGRFKYFRGSSLDLNLVGASDIAKDKAYAAHFLSQLGYPVPRGRQFFTNAWCQAIGSKQNPATAYQYARKLGWPVIVKPNSRSQGSGVCLVYSKSEFSQAVRSFEQKENVFLVQRRLPGRDYRLVVLDDEVISAYQRLPLTVVGNDRSTVLALLAAKQRQFRRVGRDTVISADDFRIENMLKRERMTLNSRPSKGQAVTLLPNANLSAGGDAIDVTDTIHPKWRQLAIKITREIGLRLCGLDLIVEGTLAEAPKRYTVLEVNAAPGLDHYASIGRHQLRLVEQLYEKVVRAMMK